MTAMVLLSTWMSSQVEFWMPVRKFPAYDVSSFGRVRSYWIKRHRRGVIGTIPKIMRPQISVKHADIALSRDGKVTRQYIHRLVAEAFIPNLNNLPEVNHITAYPADNRVDGLEWATHYDNHQHAKRNGLHAQGERNGMAFLTDRQVAEIKRRLRAGVRQKDIAKDFRLRPATISMISTGRQWTHIE